MKIKTIIHLKYLWTNDEPIVRRWVLICLLEISASLPTKVVAVARLADGKFVSDRTDW